TTREPEMPRSKQANPKSAGETQRTTIKPGKRSVAAPAELDAVALLEADHREVEGLFGQFQTATGDAEKRRLAIAICVALKVHARLEEELFYPGAYSIIDDKSLLDEAQVEHASAKDLIAQIEAGAP